MYKPSRLRSPCAIFAALSLSYTLVATAAPLGGPSANPPNTALGFFGGRLVHTATARRIEQGNGKRTTLPRQLAGSFTKVVIEGDFVVTVRQGAPAVQVTTDENLQKHIVANVSVDTLTVAGEGSYDSPGPVQIQVTVPAPQFVEIEGAGSVALAGIRVPKLTLNVDGAGSFEGSGEVENLLLTLQGTGTVALKDLKAQHVGLRQEGSSAVALTAIESADISSVGMGAVTLFGNPPKRFVHNDGAGKVAFK